MFMSSLSSFSVNPEFTHALLDLGKSSFRDPSGLLKHPFVHPGGPYGNNQWDWDSLWVLTALARYATLDRNCDSELIDEVKRCGAGVMQNFFDHQGEDGSVAILMTPEDVDWFDSTSLADSNPAKPVLGQIIKLLWGLLEEEEPQPQWLDRLDQYYQCMENRMATEGGLYAWVNDAAIGGDDDPTAWGRPPNSAGSLFLNCFLYKDLNAAADVAKACGRTELANTWLDKSGAIKRSIQEQCWHERDGFYYSVDVQSRQRLLPHRHFGQLNVNLVPTWKSIPLHVRYWTGFLPLWAGIADSKQAERVVQNHLLDSNAFWSNHGVRTLAADEPMYDPVTARGNPSNWLGPVWIISNYLVCEGLELYGFKTKADEIRQKTVALLQNDWLENQNLHENYHPDTGTGIAAPGFISWNLLALTMINAENEE
jgi:putative isomerase